MQKYIGKVFAGAALVAFCATTSLAADQLVAGKIIIVKPASLAKVLSKGTFTLPPGADDPTAAGASLLVKDLGDPMNTDTFALPAGQWKGLGNPVGAKGFKYKGAGTPADPCKVVLVKTNIVKAVCKGTGVDLTTPVVGVVAVNLSVGTGTSYCAEFGGTEVKNTATILKRKTSTAPSACSSPSGAFLENVALF